MNTTETKTILDQFTVVERAVLYARVSKDDRSKDGRNLDGQLEMGQEYVSEKGYRVVAELSEDDKGASGAEIDLPQLNQIRDMARNREFDVLIVRELDRLSRSLAKQLIVEEELNRYGVRIEYVLAEYDDTPEGRLQKHIRATIAEYEREKIKERMNRGKRLKVKSGSVIVAGRPPYGYRLLKDDKRMWLEIVEDQVPIIRLIFTWYLEGASLWEIGRRLDEMNVPPPKTGSKKWHKTTIGNILVNETYAGVWHYGKAAKDKDGKLCFHPQEEWLAVEVPAIIQPEVWQRVEAQKQHNRDRAQRNIKHEYLIAKLTGCGCCGGRVSAYSSGDGEWVGTYYKCRSRGDQDKITCELPIFRSKELDAKIWIWTKEYFKDPKTLRQKLEAYQAEQGQKNEPLLERLKVIDSLIAQYDKELDSAVRDLREVEDLDADRAKARIKSDISRLEKTLNDLDSQRNRVIAQLEAKTLTDKQIESIMEFGKKLGRALEKADKDFKKRRQLVEVLNMQVTLTIENGQKIAHISCILGEDDLCIENTTPGEPGRNTQGVFILTARLVVD